MRCHYCDREAAFAVEKDHMKVGLCEQHLRERMRELADAHAFGALPDGLDLDTK
ncbi:MULTISPECIES: DUF6757 family protein [unclassified Haladaptatus]|uniref:DUF6757 family protein n=1 Tax=unclassified Haladaptatus TaxID=2622732 RepID=UPI0023E7C340|nr:MULTISPECIES: DUF6757 family protein [unclassified Haladaptatus]